MNRTVFNVVLVANLLFTPLVTTAIVWPIHARMKGSVAAQSAAVQAAWADHDTGVNLVLSVKGQVIIKEGQYSPDPPWLIYARSNIDAADARFALAAENILVAQATSDPIIESVRLAVANAWMDLGDQYRAEAEQYLGQEPVEA